MGKKVLLTSITILAIAGILSCNFFQGESEITYGSVSVSLGSSRGTTILPEIDSSVDTYDISGTHAAGHTFSLTGLHEDDLIVEDIPTGVWTITVSGITRENTTVLEGSVEVIVEADTQTSAVVHLNLASELLSGEGRVKFSVTWEDGTFDEPVVKWKLLKDGTDESAYSQDIYGNEAIFDRKIDAGPYLISVIVADEQHYWKSNPAGLLVFNDTTSRASYGIYPQMVNSRADAAPPVFSHQSGTYNESIQVTLSADEGMTIRYTTDGTAPDYGNGTIYNEPITISSTLQLRAAAYSAEDPIVRISPAAERMYTFPDTICPVLFSIPSGTYYEPIDLELATYTEDAVILYTDDGTDPGLYVGYQYVSPLRIDSETEVEIRAVVKKGDEFSQVASSTYQIAQKLPGLTASHESGMYTEELEITLTAVDGAEIRYTLDGSRPTADTGNPYEGPILVNEESHILAAAFKEGWKPSNILTLDIEMKTGEVEISLESGTYHTDKQVTLACSTEGSRIFYTTDGSDPAEDAGILYTPGEYITVDRNCTLKAGAFCYGWEPSSLVQRDYVLQVDTVTLEEQDAETGGGREILVTCSNEDALFYYTTDSTDPVPGLHGDPVTGNRIPVDAFEYDIRVIGYKPGWDSAGQVRLQREYLGLGDRGPGGGFIFYDDLVGWDSSGNGIIEDTERDLLDGLNDGIISGRRYLEAAPPGWSEGANDPYAEWGIYRRGSVTPSARNYLLGYGETNTQNIVAYHDALVTEDPAGVEVSYYENPVLFTIIHEYNDGTVAAKLCDDAVINGIDDWFLPSRWELALMYIVFQMDVFDLPENTEGGFLPEYYWSSTEISDNDASWQSFADRSIEPEPKKNSGCVRPIHTF